MEVDNIVIKTEPEDEFIHAYATNVFDCNRAQNCVKTEGNPSVAYLPTKFNTEEIGKSSMRFINCINEFVDSTNNEESVPKQPEMKIEDIFDEDDKVDLSKLKQLLNDNEMVPACEISKLEDKESNRSTSKQAPAIHQPKQRKTRKKEIKIHKCSHCSYQTTVKPYLRRHSKSHNEDRPKINCQLCDKSFTIKRSLDDHLVKHHKIETKRKLYKCDICNYQTILKFRLSSHIDSTHNKDRVKLNCEFCNKSFTLKMTLDDHMLKQHANEIKKDSISSDIYTCSICSNYETTNKNALSQHVKSKHNNERVKINCLFCDKSFTMKQSHDDHLVKQHRGEINDDLEKLISSKIHKCIVCFYETAYKSNLDKHKCKS